MIRKQLISTILKAKMFSKSRFLPFSKPINYPKSKKKVKILSNKFFRFDHSQQIKKEIFKFRCELTD